MSRQTTAGRRKPALAGGQQWTQVPALRKPREKASIIPCLASIRKNRDGSRGYMEWRRAAQVEKKAGLSEDEEGTLGAPYSNNWGQERRHALKSAC